MLSTTLASNIRFIAIILVDLSMSISPAGRGLMPKQLAPAKAKNMRQRHLQAEQKRKAIGRYWKRWGPNAFLL
jgi:hypothetical protein